MPLTRILFLASGITELPANGALQKFSEALLEVKPELGDDLKGFISASVKWRPKGKFLVNKNLQPPIVGQSPLRYSAKGEPQLAQWIEKSAQAMGLWAEATEEWGLDFGHLHPLMLLRPEADRLVIPVSLSQMSPEAHRKWGIAIRKGSQKWPDPLTLIVSGSLSFRPDLAEGQEETLKAKQFDDDVIEYLRSGTIGKLDEMERSLFKAAQPEGGSGSLYFLWGALGENVSGKVYHYQRPYPGIGRTAILFTL